MPGSCFRQTAWHNLEGPLNKVNINKENIISVGNIKILRNSRQYTVFSFLQRSCGRVMVKC